MSDSEEVQAAATGAAAAVAAVQDDQAEADRQQAMEASTVDAELAAETAAEEAQQAAQTAAAAVEAVQQAGQEAALAGAVATEAATEAQEAKSELAMLREELAARHDALVTTLNERLPEKTSSETPTQVVVTNDTGTDPAAQRGTNTGGSGSSGPGSGDERPYRHRFGNRRH